MFSVFNKLVRGLLLFLPQQKRLAIERWLRGWNDARKLRQADCVIVSFGKSGRTWLRVMLSRFYQVQYGLSERSLLSFDNFYRKNSAIPRILFTHDNYIKDYTHHSDSKIDFYDKKVILLVRDPRDVAVSQFFQWKHRMPPIKKALNQYPAHGTELTVYDFVMDKKAGIPKVIDFMNAWASELPRIQSLLLIRYEDLRARPEALLKQIVEFIGTPGSQEQIHEAVTFAAYENMKKLEEKKRFRLSGRQMLPSDRSNPDSFKVRRAKVGGYRDYFENCQRIQIDRLMDSLDPLFGYKRDNHQAIDTDPLVTRKTAQ